MIKVTILTLFPELFPGILGHSLTGKALTEGKWQLEVVNIRDYTTDKHKTVDDTPYGGGAGMLMRADVIAAAIDALKDKPDIWFYPSPRGPLWKQQTSAEISTKYQHIGILCGRYEGVDQRVLDAYGMHEISIGDYVLTGGEMAAYVMVDSMLRHLPQVLGNHETLDEESLSGDYEFLLEYPHYTRPAEWRGQEVPSVLRSGNHAEIEKWRLNSAKDLTKRVRPDIWEHFLLKDKDQN